MLWFSCGEVFSNQGVSQNNEPMKSCTMIYTSKKCSWIFFFRNGNKYPGTKNRLDILFQIFFSVYILPPMLLNQCSMLHQWMPFVILSLLSQIFLINESKRLLNAWVYIWTNLMIDLLIELAFKYEINMTPSCIVFFQLMFQIIVKQLWINFGQLRSQRSKKQHPIEHF